MNLESKNISYKTFALVAIFLVGNLIIRFPKGEGQEHSFIGFLSCFIVSSGLAYFLNRIHFSKNEFGMCLFENYFKNNFLNLLLKFFVFLLLLFCFITTTKDYTGMLSDIRLQNFPVFLLAAVYLAVVLLLALCKDRVVYFFSFTNLILISLGIILMFLFSINLFNFSFLKEGLAFNGKNVLNQGLTFFIHSFGQIYLCALFLAKNKNQNSKHGVVLGVLVGGVLLLICFLNVILSIGSQIINGLQYPYASVTAMLVSKDAYNRMDVITYYIYFICNLIKSSVLLKLIYGLFKKKYINYIFLILTLFAALFFSTSEYLGAILLTKTFNLILLCLEILLPIIVTLLLSRTKIKQKTDL